ncbi:5-oxoprolinase subunit C family protein [Heliobacterium mobile]|uniref:5-oxoprolinase subunit C family protein n=1 Tax=Heliobacterium mobile TaxID=28064 RepID=UPI002E2622BB
MQDLGRYGHQASGMPVAGAMDTFSLQAANLLVGNNPGDGALEITLAGPRLRFLSPGVIAITGADLSPTLDGEPLSMWVNCPVGRGSILAFGTPRSGCRSYLAVSGGWAVEPVLGSRSTYLRGQLGGFQGRALKEGDQLQFHPGKRIDQLGTRQLCPDAIPVYSRQVTVRAILGPQEDFFAKDAIETFFSKTYRVSALSDRMGYRLEGPRLNRQTDKEMISDATTLGAVQVPPDGQPIVLMADRQTTGGYPKIVTVITADVPLLAQAKMGDTVQFIPCDIPKAHSILRQQRDILRNGIVNGACHSVEVF